MARYFRCEEPGGQCPHALTRELLVDAPGVCPLNHGDCAQWRRPVPWVTAQRARNPAAFWTLTGLAALVMVALLLSLLFGGHHWRADLDRLQAQFTALNDRLTTLERQAPRPPDTGDAWAQLQDDAAGLRGAVQQAVAGHTGADAGALQARLADLEQQLQALTGSGAPGAKHAQAQAMARQLVADYQTLRNAVVAAQASAPPDDAEAPHAFKTLLVDLDRGLKRAQRLAAPVPPPPPPPAGTTVAVAAALTEARDGLDVLSASLTVATSPLLAKALVLPLLEARAAGGAVRPASDGRHWFVASDDPALSPGLLVAVADADPYGPLLAGRADLAIADHAPDGQTQAEFAARFPGQAMIGRDHATVVALDAVALLGHATRTSAPVMDLRQGRWGADGAAAPVIAGLFPALTLSPVADPFSAVQGDPSALSAVFHHQWQRHPVGQLLALQPSRNAPALKPSEFSIGTENYPLTYRVLATRSPASRPGTADLLTWITADAGQSAVKAAGFVDLRLLPKAGQQTADPLILSALGRAVGHNVTGAEQYPTNLRFALNQAELDIKAQADVERLIGPLQGRTAQGYKVVILGFTDDLGGDEQNYLLSVARARQVAERLAKLGVQTVTAGLGEELPVDTNDTDEGRARNRRAEVWVVAP